MIQSQLLEDRLKDWTSKIETLDQEKIYVIFASDKEEADMIYQAFKTAASRMQWTAPSIIVLVMDNSKMINIAKGEMNGRNNRTEE